jgi:hypothetical protein
MYLGAFTYRFASAANDRFRPSVDANLVVSCFSRLQRTAPNPALPTLTQTAPKARFGSEMLDD